MEFKYPNTKKLFLTVEVSQLLNRHSCTYEEANAVVELIASYINHQLDEYGLDSVVKPMNHVEPYC